MSPNKTIEVHITCTSPCLSSVYETSVNIIFEQGFNKIALLFAVKFNDYS